MDLLRKISSFGATVEDIKTIYRLCVRSQLEQSAVVRSSSITKQNKERVQIPALTLIRQRGGGKFAP